MTVLLVKISARADKLRARKSADPNPISMCELRFIVRWDFIQGVSNASI